MPFRKPTEGDVLLYRAEHKCSLYEAKDRLMFVAVRKAVFEANSFDELKALILQMLDMAEKERF